ncbi:MAG TPA: response regulator transcription factor [Candidatus Saccharimonadales bacterium]|nr:response regulator transcription factor [Candidatus Saccharimonadales bacterium]
MDNFNKSLNSEKTILVADDNRDILESMKILLEMEGYDVITTSHGEEITSMLQLNPDLLLMDIWLAGIDGRDVCRHIKSKSETRGVPIIMISASKNIKRSAMDSGADDFIAKPFEIDDVLGKVKKHLFSN